MRITFWGVRGSIAVPGPSTARYGGNTPCISMEDGDDSMIILDAGTGIRRLGMTIMDRLEDLSLALLITHLHWDHIQGLPFFTPIYDPRTSLDIYAGDSGELTLDAALARQMSEPFFPVDWGNLPSTVRVHGLEQGGFELNGFKITAAKVEHAGPSLGYRLEHGGRTVVYTGDREGEPTDWRAGRALLELCEGADLLITDAHFEASEYEEYRGWGHAALEHAVDLGRRAGAGRLVLFHHAPERDDEELDRLAERLKREHGDRVVLAAEGMVIDL